ncbi:MAG: ATP-binding protein [Bacillus sp. (in: firmicutes)]
MLPKNKEDNWTIKDRKSYSKHFIEKVEQLNWNNYHVGSLLEVADGFGLVIRDEAANKGIIFFGMKKWKTNLNIQEKVWLETLSYFSSILLENFQLIENLVEKMEDYKEMGERQNTQYPYWLSRLLFSLSEKERANLSIDLHDSVLQDQLQLLREVEKIKGEITDKSIQNDLLNLKERMLDNIHLIRETCNELRPPLLNELGIIQCIQHLIEQTKIRCNFILKSKLDLSIKMLDKEYELTLYRVVQELLNNAMKHSFASEVKITLWKNNQTISLKYEDNGKGIDRKELNDSFHTMGIFGMKERITSVGGTIDINSSLGKGMQVLIEIKTGGNEYD